MKRLSVKMVSAIMAIVMILSLGTTTLAAGTTAMKKEVEPEIDTLFLYVEKISRSEHVDQHDSRNKYTELSGEITDISVIKRLYEQGIIELNEDGSMPQKVVVTQFILNNTEENIHNSTQATKGGISITKTNYYDGRYFDEYDRYVVSGPCEFTQTYSRTSTASWNTNMTGSVTVSGTVYSIADVKAAVSSSMGYYWNLVH